jgi:hypothetical protein
MVFFGFLEIEHAPKGPVFFLLGESVGSFGYVLFPLCSHKVFNQFVGSTQNGSFLSKAQGGHPFRKQNSIDECVDGLLDFQLQLRRMFYTSKTHH